MDKDFRVVGRNNAAPFSLIVHRGEGMMLLAMDWRDGMPPKNFAGFAILYREPDSAQLKTMHNRIGFPGQDPGDRGIRTTQAPIQKFRWVLFPSLAAKEGQFQITVKAMFADDTGKLTEGGSQEVEIALMRETLPGKLNVSFTRGYVSSQAFVTKYQSGGGVATLLPDKDDAPLEFRPTHPLADEAYRWMGFEARATVLELLERAISAPDAEVRAIAFDLNVPMLVDMFAALGPRLKIIIDNSKSHGPPNKAESIAAKRLQDAGVAAVTRQKMGALQHHKSIAVRGGGIDQVLFGSTNLSWRGFFVQSNNSLLVSSRKAVDDYFECFDDYATLENWKDFKSSRFGSGWHDLGIGADAHVAYSPRPAEQSLLAEIAEAIDNAKSSVFFSLAFLHQITRGPTGAALGKALQREDLHVLGVADGRVKDENFGLIVLTPDQKRRVVRSAALTGNVPAPFLTEPSSLVDEEANYGGTRMHHKFVVIDFDTDNPIVYAGSHNLSERADHDNGENLVRIKDRTVATSYMIEALRIYDHYVFRAATEDAKKRNDGPGRLELKLPPKGKAKAWFERDWSDPIRARDRKLFSRN